MGQGLGSARRSRRGVAAVAAVVLAAIAITLGGAMLAGVPAPWAAQVPQTIYVIFATREPAATTGGAAATSSPARPTGIPAGPSASNAADPSPGAGATTLAPAATRRATVAPFPTPTPARPNLAIGGYSNPWLICGLEFDMQIDVVNNGAVASTATTARLVDTFDGTVAISANKPIPALAPHASALVVFPVTVHTGCGETHVMVITLDPGNLVLETSETDNILEYAHTPLAKPNLTMPPATLSLPATPTCNVDFTVGVVVVNNGYGPTPRDALVRFRDYYGDLVVKTVYVSIPALPVGANRAVSVTFRTSTWCNHAHLMEVTVDPAHDVSEMSESDNVLTRAFTPHLGS